MLNLHATNLWGYMLLCLCRVRLCSVPAQWAGGRQCTMTQVGGEIQWSLPSCPRNVTRLSGASVLAGFSETWWHQVQHSPWRWLPYWPGRPEAHVHRCQKRRRHILKHLLSIINSVKTKVGVYVGKSLLTYINNEEVQPTPGICEVLSESIRHPLQ